MSLKPEVLTPSSAIRGTAADILVLGVLGPQNITM